MLTMHSHYVASLYLHFPLLKRLQVQGTSQTCLILFLVDKVNIGEHFYLPFEMSRSPFCPSLGRTKTSMPCVFPTRLVIFDTKLIFDSVFFLKIIFHLCVVEPAFNLHTISIGRKICEFEASMVDIGISRPTGTLSFLCIFVT